MYDPTEPAPDNLNATDMIALSWVGPAASWPPGSSQELKPPLPEGRRRAASSAAGAREGGGSVRRDA